MDRVDVFARAAHGLRALEPDGAKLAKYIQFIDIYAALTDKEYEGYRRRYPEESRTMAGMIQRARDEGMRAGRDEGKRQGLAEVLEQQVAHRSGPLSPAVSDRLHRASVAALQAWAGRLLDARTLDDVFDQDPPELGR